MKLTGLLLLVFCLQVGATGFTQTVTLSEKNVPLEKVFSVIEKQTEYVFFFEHALLQRGKPVTIDAKKAPLIDILDACFAGQPFTYSIEGSIITIVERTDYKPAADNKPESNKEDSTMEVSGKVQSERGESLSSATIRLRRNNSIISIIITDAKGGFRIGNAREGDYLIVSFVGYGPKVIQITNSKYIVIQLSEASAELDKVVVQGYGTTTQRLNTGNIATVTAVEIERQPVANVLQALQGKVPGLVLTQNNGYRSTGFKVELRGRSVIDPSLPSEPLYIIDGVPLTVLNISGRGGYSTGSPGFLQNTMTGPAKGQSPLFSINPSDIESISVLKDADATAIYGSRGANGVIIINTKKGKPGKTKFDIDVSTGVSFVRKFYDILDTKDYVAMRKEAFANDGITPQPGNAFDLLIWDTTRFTNWQKYFWGGQANNTDMDMSLSGGNSLTTFRIGAGYHKWTSLNNFDGSDQRASMQFNLTHKSLSEKFNVSFSTLYTFTRSDLIDFQGGILIPPNAPPIFDDNGKLNWKGWEPSFLFKFGYLLEPYTSKTGFLNSQLKVSYTILSGLTFNANFGYSLNTGFQKFKRPITAQNPLDNPVGMLTVGNNMGNRAIVEPEVVYKRPIGTGEISIVAGAAYQVIQQEGSMIIGQGYTNDNLLSSISNATSLFSSDNIGEYKYAAAFSRISYNYHDKYIINLSARRDGSSKFGPRKQWGNFWAVGAAWILSEEEFLKPWTDVLTFAKVRASYGATGSDIIGDYKYLTRWSSSSTAPYLSSPSYIPLQHANPDLQWQVDKKLEVALSVGFLNRHNLEVSLYRNRVGNQLVIFNLPLATGFSSISANMPAVIQNKGIELTINNTLLSGKNTKWDFNLNFGLNQNKLLSFPDIEQSPYALLYQVGKSLNVKRLLKFTGVDQEKGLYTFEDVNEDGIIDGYSANNNDLISEKDLSINFIGGWGMNFSWKSFAVNMQFEFRKQYGLNIIYTDPFIGRIGNQSVESNNRWQKPGDLATFAKRSTLFRDDISSLSVSDAMYIDASFMRLNNISLSYDVPATFSKKLGIQGLKAYIRGQNLLVITNYKGLDPETQVFGAMPPLATVIGGLQFNF